MLRGACLLAGVLVLHWVVLVSLRDRLFDSPVVKPMPMPLFTRFLQAAAPSVPAPRALPRPKRPKAMQNPVAPGDEVQSPTEKVTNVVPDSLAADGGVPQAGGEAADAATLLEDPPAPSATEAGSVADHWPADTRLSYSLKGYYRGDLYGSGQVQWQHSDGRYQVLVDLRMALIVTVHLISQGELREDGLQPRVYEERGMGRVRRLAFDGTEVTFHDGTAMAQPEGLQDTASQFVELTRRFSSGRQTLAVGTPVSLWLARPREMNLWTYDVVALETLELPEWGSVPAYHLQPRPVANPRGVVQAELWFAPSLQYLPVRIRINLGGDNYADLVVNRIEQGDSLPSESR